MSIAARSRRLFIGSNTTPSTDRVVYSCPPGTTALVKRAYVFNVGAAPVLANIQHRVPAGGQVVVAYDNDLPPLTVVTLELDLVLEEADELIWYQSGEPDTGQLAVYGSQLQA